MNSLLRTIRIRFQASLVGILCLTLPMLSSANVANSATAVYADASSATSYTAASNTYDIVTPPVITSSTSTVCNFGVAFATYTITATNSPTSFSQTGLPAGLSLNSTSGAITGVPSILGVFPVSLRASNAAGPGPVFTLTITIQGAPQLDITISSDKTFLGFSSTQTVTYTIAYKNNGTGDATNIVLRDVLPAALLTPFMISNGGTATAAGEQITVTWIIGTVGVGQSGSVSFTSMVNPFKF